MATDPQDLFPFSSSGPSWDDGLPDIIPEHRLVRNPATGGFWQLTPQEFESFLPDPEPTPKPQAQAEPDTPEWADYGRLYMAGSAQLAQGAGWLAQQMGLEDVGKTIETLGSDAVDYWNEGLTPAMQAELSKEFVKKNAEGGYEWGDAGFRTVAAMGVQSLPGTAAGMGMGGGIAKVLQVFANPVGRSVLVKAAVEGSAAAAKKLKVIDSVTGMVGFGLGEGITAGMVDAPQIKQAVLSMDPDKLAANPRYQQIIQSTDDRMSELEKHQYAAETIANEAASRGGLESGLVVGLLGAPMGAFFGRLLGRSALKGVVGAAEHTRLGTMGLGAAGEAGQEFLQSGAEQLIQNREVINAGDTELDPWSGVLNQAVGGAVAGGLMGGAFGTMEPTKPRAATPGTPGTPQQAIRAMAEAAVAAGAESETVITILAGVEDGSIPYPKATNLLRTLDREARKKAPVEPPPAAAQTEPAEPTAAAAIPRTPQEVLSEIGRLANEAAGGNHPAVPDVGLADGTWAGDGTLDMDGKGNVILTRVSDHEDHLGKGWENVSGQELIDTSLSHGGGRGLPTSGRKGWTDSFGATRENAVVGTFTIPVAELLDMVRRGDATLGNIGEGEIVLNPQAARQYLTDVQERTAAPTVVPTAKPTKPTEAGPQAVYRPGTGEEIPVEVLGQEGDYVRVRAPGQKGWTTVPKEKVVMVGGTVEETAPTPASTVPDAQEPAPTSTGPELFPKSEADAARERLKAKQPKAELEPPPAEGGSSSEPPPAPKPLVKPLPTAEEKAAAAAEAAAMDEAMMAAEFSDEAPAAPAPAAPAEESLSSLMLQASKWDQDGAIEAFSNNDSAALKAIIEANATIPEDKYDLYKGRLMDLYLDVMQNQGADRANEEIPDRQRDITEKWGTASWERVRNDAEAAARKAYVEHFEAEPVWQPDWKKPAVESKQEEKAALGEPGSSSEPSSDPETRWDAMDYGKRQKIAEVAYAGMRPVVHRISGSKWSELSPGERKSVTKEMSRKPAGTAPEHARNEGKPLDEGVVYEPTGEPDHVTFDATLGEITDLNISLEEFKKATDEWAALFADPEETVKFEQVEKGKPKLTTEEAAVRLAEWKQHVRNQFNTIRGENSQRTILSLFDYTGEWSKPYEEAGYNVIRFDIQNGLDVMDFSVEYFNENWDFGDVYGILCAVPCTDFASSGARHFATKDADGRTEASKELVFQALRTIEYFKPAFWVMENPVGRIERLTGLPAARASFHPYHFGAPYTKKTMLWGKFNANMPTAIVEPTEGSKIHRLWGGKSLATKNARSETPEGFAYAFFMANNYADTPVVDRLQTQYPEASGAIAAALKAGVPEDDVQFILRETYENYEYEQARTELAKAANRAGLRKGKENAAEDETPEPTATEPAPTAKEQYEVSQSPQEIFKGVAGLDQIPLDQRTDELAAKILQAQIQWWDKTLTGAGRADILKSVGSKLPAGVAWQHMTPPARMSVDHMRSGEFRPEFQKEAAPEEAGPKEFKKGDRVVVGKSYGEGFEGRHGVVTDVSKTTWTTSALGLGRGGFGLTEVKKETTISYTVKTDGGVEVNLNEAEIAKETGEAPEVQPDVRFGNTFYTPEHARSLLDRGRRDIKGAEGKLARARTAKSKAEWRRELETRTAKQAAMQSEYEAWAKENSEDVPAAPAAVPNTVQTGTMRLIESKHPKTSAPMFVVSLTTRVSPEEFGRLRTAAKERNGYWYGRGRTPGFTFNEKSDAESFMGGKEQAEKKPAAKLPAARLSGNRRFLEGRAASPPVEVKPNTVFTEDAADAARARLKAKMNRANAGIDPEMMQDGITLAGYHIEKGARTFSAYIRAMIADLGDWVKPYLKSWYMGVYYNPQAAELQAEMTPAAEVDTADVEALLRVPAENDRFGPTEGEGNGPEADRGDSETALAGGIPGGVQGPGQRGSSGKGGQRGGQADTRGNAELDDNGSLGAGGLPGESPPVRPDRPPEPVINGPVGAGDYEITDADRIGQGTPGERIRYNLDAIRLIRKLEAENRPATLEEQRILVKYVGWGGLKNVFDPASKSRQEQEAHAELKRLLTPKELFEARQSTLNAFYTSPTVVRAMYKFVKHFGFTGGNVLEPTVGTGNFIGLMPAELKAGSQWFASELDPMTSLVAKYLYPQSKILTATGFQNAEFSYGKFDLAIGNPPFGDEKITDKRRKDLSGLKIHNYVIAKSGRHLRPGGVMAMVVTSRFLDTANPEGREILSQDFRFLGAVRLPNNAFKENAGTEVTTDLVFLQKLPEDSDSLRTQAANLWFADFTDQLTAQSDWLETGATMTNAAGETITLNRYFANRPELMLGEPSMKGTMYGGKEEFTLNSRPGQDTGILLDAALSGKHFAPWRDVMLDSDKTTTDDAIEVNKVDVPVGGYWLDDGNVYMREDDDEHGNPTYLKLTPDTQWTPKTKLGIKKLARIRGMLEIRQAAYDLMRLERADAPTKEINASRKALNKLYDAFVKAHGYLNDSGNSSLIEDQRIEFGLETNYRKPITPAVAKRTGQPVGPSKADKASLLIERVFTPHKTITSAANVRDGYNISLSEHGKLDVPYIASLTGKTEAQVIEELSKAELAFQDPETLDWVQEDLYLSGNVKAKLQSAEAQRGYERNVEALKKVLPKDVPVEDIYADLGATWIPVSAYESFANLIGVAGAKVTITEATGRVSIISGVVQPNEINAGWINDDYTISDLFNRIANKKPLLAYDRMPDGTRVINKERTTALKPVGRQIRQFFQDWIFADQGRAVQITKTYNDTQNTHAERKFNGQLLRMSGNNPGITLLNSQRNAAWRMIQSPIVLLDHVVGAGKTYTMVAGIMERKRLGLSQKPMVVVPNHLVNQWARDWLALYPGANILAATEKDFAKKNRRRLFARIATGKYDAIIVGHSSFEFVPLLPETESAFIGEEIAFLERSLGEATESGDRQSIRTITNRIAKKQARLEALMDSPRDQVASFEEMGIDYLAVDEFHEFKNLEYSTTLANVAGMGNPQGARKSFDLYSKIQYLIGQGGGVSAGTGTPVSNSLVELYTVLRYLNRAGLKARQQEVFDAWAGTYASIDSRLEYTASGRIKERAVFASFNNLPELMQLYTEFSDIITMRELKRLYAEQIRERNAKTGGHEREEFPVPKVKDGGRVLHAADPSPLQREYMDYLVARSQAAEGAGRDYGSIDNALWIISDAKKMALDMRIVMPTAPDHPDSKVSRAAVKIKEIYDRTKGVRGTQLVFCDLSTPAKTAEKNVKAHLNAALKMADAPNWLKRDIEGLSYLDQWKRIRNYIQESIDSGRLEDRTREKLEKYLEENERDIEAEATTATVGFSVYDDLKAKLVASGVPENEVRFIHEANTRDQKQEMFDLVNDGAVRVLIGSTPKMGAGTNVQMRVVAEHHMDSPWKPAEIEQREGRVIRQGNLFYAEDPDGFQMEIHAYSTRHTFDAVMWQTLQRKAEGLEQFRYGLRTMEEGEGDAKSYAEFMAESTGNEAFREKYKLEGEIAELEATRNRTRARLAAAKQSKEQGPARIAEAERAVAGVKTAITATEDNPTYEYQGTSYTYDSDRALSEENAAYGNEVAAYHTAMEQYVQDRKTWEDAPPKGRGVAPTRPIAPEKPTLLSPRVADKSDWAKFARNVVGDFVNNVNRSKDGAVPAITLKIGGMKVSIAATAQAKNGERTFRVVMDIPDRAHGSALYDHSQKTVPADSIAQALRPIEVRGRLNRSLEWDELDLRTAKTSLKQANTILQGAAFAGQARLDEAKAQYATVLKTVERLELRESARRAKSKNQFIEADTDRPLAQFANTLGYPWGTRALINGITPVEVVGEAELVEPDPMQAVLTDDDQLRSVPIADLEVDVGNASGPFAPEFPDGKDIRLKRLAKRAGIHKGKYTEAQGGPNAAPPTAPTRRALYAKRGDSSPMFYSALLKAVEGLPQAKAPPDQWAGILSNLTGRGVKQEELDWLDPVGWLQEMAGPENSKAPVTKEQLLNYIRANQVTVEETVLPDESPAPQVDRAIRVLQDAGYLVEESDWGDAAITAPDGHEITGADELMDLPVQISDAIGTIWSRAEELGENGEGTKFSQYTLPGGENYRELLIRLPQYATTGKTTREQLGEPTVMSPKEFAKEIGFEADDLAPPGSKMLVYRPNGATLYITQLPDGQYHVMAGNEDQLARNLENAESWLLDRMGPEIGLTSESYNSPHWEEPNIVAHVRFDERTSADGKKTLFIEEIQSDWHQAGREEGYALASERRWNAWDSNGRLVGGAADSEARAREQAGPGGRVQEIGTSLVPDAPFKTTWPELALKRMVRWAAENGFDQIAWTTGEQQADRYNLAKQVDDVKVYERFDNVGWNINAHKDGKLVIAEYVEDEARLRDLLGKDMAERALEQIASSERPAVQANGLPEGYKLELFDDGEGFRGWVVRAPEESGFYYNIAEVPGGSEEARKEAIKQALDAIERRGLQSRGRSATFTGDALKIGGQGMKGFYNKMIPRMAARIGKKFGAKTGETQITTGPTQWNVRNAEGGLRSFQTRWKAEKFAEESGGEVIAVNAETVHALELTPELKAAALAGQPLFNRPPTAGGMSRAQVAKILAEPIKKVAGFVRFHIVDQAPAGAPRGVAGVYYEGTQDVYLVASELPNEAEVVRVFTHEVFGHLAPERHKWFQDALDGIIRLNRMGSKEIKDHWAAVGGSHGALDPQTQAKEVLARMAEQGSNAPLMERLIARVREFLRSIGLVQDWTAADIRGFIRSAARGLQQRSAQAGLSAELEAALTKAGTNPTAILAALRRADGASNQTDTFTFRRWFGESKVVNPDGTPKEVYHGATRDLEGDRFKRGKAAMSRGQSLGYHFGSAQAASDRVQPAVDDALDWSHSEFTPNTIPVYLKVENPLRLRDIGAWQDADWVNRALTDAGLPAMGSTVAQITKALEARGYDGIVYENEFEGGGLEKTDSYIVFKPNQIKSSIGNVGSFDDSANILRAVRLDPLYARSAPMDAALESIYDEVMGVPHEDMSPKDRIRSFVTAIRNKDWLDVKQGMIDAFASVKALEEGTFGSVLDAAQSAYKAILATRNHGSVMAAVFQRGVPEYRDGTFQVVPGRKGFLEIFEPLTNHADGNLMKHWKLWAAATRAERLMAEGREHLFTAEQIEQAKALGDQYPEFQSVMDDWQEMNGQALDLGEALGIIDARTRPIWEKNDYVPFYRVMEEIEGVKGPGRRGGIANQGSPIKTLKGGEAQLGDIIENMAMNLSSIIDRSFKNSAMQRVVDLADGVAMEREKLPWLPQDYKNADIKRALEAAGIDMEAMTDEQKREYTTLFHRVMPRGHDIVSVMVNGRPVYYRVSDPLLLRSITAMGADTTDAVLGLFRGAKRMLTGAVTADPAFMLANFIRDTLSTWVVTGASFHPFTGPIKGIKQSLQESPELFQMMMAGGGGGGYYESQPSDIKKVLGDKLPENQAKSFLRSILSPGKAWKAWHRIGGASENANRLAVYNSVLERGGSVAEAAYQARDVLNFSMAGDYKAMQVLIQTVPFMNARIQGLYRLARGGRDNPKAFAMRGFLLLAATMALMFKNQDEKDYEELPEWDKDTYWHVFLGGEHFRIPKPFEVGIMFGVIPERMWRWGTGRDSNKVIWNAAGSAIANTLAFNPIPQLVKPIVEQYANRNMFFGSPIVGMGLQGTLPEAQYNPWTSESMRALAVAMPDWAPEWLRSPVRLQAAVQGYFGTLGSYALSASDYVVRDLGHYPEAPASSMYDLPVLRRFLRDPNPKTTKYATELYDMLNEANAVFSTIKSYREQGELKKAAKLLEENRGKLMVRGRLNKLALQVRQINNQINAVQFSPLSAEEKRAKIEKLRELKNKVTGQVAPLAEYF